MRRKKVVDRILTVMEAVLLAGMVLLSLYLLYQSVKKGEQAVNGTAAVADQRSTSSENAGDRETEPGAVPETEVSEDLFSQIEEESLSVRVRILSDNYEKDLFDEITVVGSDGFLVERGTYDDAYQFRGGTSEDTPDSIMTFASGETCTMKASDLNMGEAFHIAPEESGTLTVTSLTRTCGSPVYGGELYIYCLEDGLALVNVLELEEYLYAVVSSEMPSYFPAEALKAQAVCARTCALLCLNEHKNEKTMADLDDSVRYQVYNNQKSTEESCEAVNATRGIILSLDEVQYYSTSCLSEDREDLKEEDAFRAFLAELPETDAEYGSAWLRWETELPVSVILERLADEYGIQTETLDEISVQSRSGSGQALLLRLTAGGESVEIEGEYAIREFLSPGEAEVELMDGSSVTGMTLLPSAFFSFTLEDTKAYILHIYGGGYGHGIGMSQYGAAQMAAEGASYREILEYYYS